MKVIPVGEFKAHFSEILDLIRDGHELTISYGRKKEKIAVILPYENYKKTKIRKLGLLKDKASFEIMDDWSIDDATLFTL